MVTDCERLCAGRLVLSVALPVTALLALAAGPAAAQQDRERAQMLQMQQQLQRLQSDNAALQSSARQDGEKLKEQTRAAESAQRDLKQLRAQSEAKGRVQARELEDLHGQLSGTQEALTAARTELEKLHKELAQRDEALAAAAVRQQRTESQAAFLGQRLKLQTARSDQCEIKHTDAMLLANRLVDQIAHERLRLCEPFTGLWKVKAESDVQALREKVNDLQLESLRVEVKQ